MMATGSAPLAPLLRRLDGDRPDQAHPLGWRCFQLGLFVLASSALMAVVPLFVALVLGSRGRMPWWRDRLNLWLLAAAVLMVLGAVLARPFPGYGQGLAWLGLMNWLPFFWGFWGFQPYVGTVAARRRLGLWLLAGTVPVLVTGLGQMGLGWHGPFQALGGLIIWHLREGGRPHGRLSGLFDYANITAAWLALGWPFVLAALVAEARRWRQGLAGGWRAWLPLAMALLLVVAQVAAMVLTDSRNAWGALVLAVPLVLGPSSWLWLLPLWLLALVPVLLASLPVVPPLVQGPARALVPEAIWGRLTDLQFAADRPQALTRLSQWTFALGLIAERPWFGWGAAAFSVIYQLRIGKVHGHPHNIAIDLAVSHGLPVALIVVGLVLWLLIRALRRGMAAGRLFDRAWWAAALALVVLHASDIPMYDSRINIAGWILLAGLRWI